MTFQLGGYRQYADVVENIENQLADLLPGFTIDRANKIWTVNDITITPEI